MYYNPVGDTIGSLLFSLIITVVIALILREPLCWYWKINKRIRIQENILAELVRLNRAYLGETEEVKQPLASGQEYCPQCGAPSLEKNATCEVCGQVKR